MIKFYKFQIKNNFPLDNQNQGKAMTNVEYQKIF